MKVAYLTMAYCSLLWYRKIFTVLWQDYPPEQKVHIISCQKSSVTGKFPKIIKHDLPHQIIQRNIEGTWPGLWALKLWDTIEVADEAGCDALIILDEDDEFPSYYTGEVLKKLADADAAWSYRNIDAINGSVMGYGKPVEYDSAIGTLVMKMEPLKKAAAHLKHLFPTGESKPRRRRKGGALDARFKVIVHSHFNVVEHNVLRGYFRTPWTNSIRRPLEEDIGADFDYSQIRDEKVYKHPKWFDDIQKERKR